MVTGSNPQRSEAAASDHSCAVVDAFVAEGDALVAVLSGCGPGEWATPTGCPPWTVAELAAHVELACGRVLTMLDDAGPLRGAGTDAVVGTVGSPLVDAVGYYRADARFSVASNADRVRTAQDRAAQLGAGAGVVGAGVARALATTCSAVAAQCASEPADRIVVTRHGDPMRLRDFLVTRVVELVVHGLDLAAALDRAPWSSEPGLRVVLRLFLGEDDPDLAAQLGLTPTALLLKLTGRADYEDDERARIDAIAPRRLTLG